ncbi:MAG: hypothetical protein CME31_22300 [Gimesia sp.]|nr:hypothetical protein [Gimesia sp.]
MQIHFIFPSGGGQNNQCPFYFTFQSAPANRSAAGPAVGTNILSDTCPVDYIITEEKKFSTLLRQCLKPDYRFQAGTVIC